MIESNLLNNTETSEKDPKKEIKLQVPFQVSFLCDCFTVFLIPISIPIIVTLLNKGLSSEYLQNIIV